jgi:hypothetical protein
MLTKTTTVWWKAFAHALCAVSSLSVVSTILLQEIPQCWDLKHNGCRMFSGSFAAEGLTLDWLIGEVMLRLAFQV